jgi:3-oxoacyl-[acyl-carrier protein] reductase
MRLAGRSAIITGASRGLGRAIAEAYWNEGASLLLTASREGPLADVAGALSGSAGGERTLVVVPCDLSQPGAVPGLVARARETFDTLSVLVNNAATLGPIGPLWETPTEEWERNIRVNLLAPAELCAAVLPWLGEHRGGKVINLSGGGASGPRPNFSAYACAKAALVRLTEVLAHEASSLGVDVNAIAPGALNTRMLAEVLEAGPARVGLEEFEAAQRRTKEGDAALVRAVQLAVFLASSESDGVSGRLISAVWDDWSRLAEHREELRGSDVYTLRRIVPTDRNLEW